jgi:hypothetical protein
MLATTVRGARFSGVYSALNLAERVRRKFSRQGCVLVEGFPLGLAHGGPFFDRLGLRHSGQDEGDEVGDALAVLGRSFRVSRWAGCWLVSVQTMTPCADVFFESCRCIATGDSFIPPLSSIVVVVVHLRFATCLGVREKKLDSRYSGGYAPDVGLFRPPSLMGVRPVVRYLISSVSVLVAQAPGDMPAPGPVESLIAVLILLAGPVLLLATLAGLWKIFAKAGKPGWAALVPIYNLMLLGEIAGKPAWFGLLALIPCVGLIPIVMMYVGLARNFRKSEVYALGMVFLPFLFVPLLGFSDAKYKPVSQ